MKNLKAHEIRQMWLDFFRSKGHEVTPSASLLPQDDPTLLWINAGVAPLKKYFDGREKPNNPRLCNAQKSIRTNDIENVGKTARHHTFFEMLGNFSIGNYFREEVLTWAYELLFSQEWFAFDKDLIYITYYTKDLDTFNKWVSLGVKEDHLIALDDNFWEIGEGPCGPDTEIFFDRGLKYDPENIGIKMIKEDIENDRFIEIWNIVFSQFNSQSGKRREEYPELPSKNIDTGAGLERLACVMQGTETNYESDLFMPMIKYLEEKTSIKYNGQMSFKVIVDHIRSITFALSDGATFGNSGRGYVLRRILRRAVRYAKKLNINSPFLYQMVQIVADNMKEYYPYLQEKVALVAKLIKIEEENFWKTLEKGEKKLSELIQNLDGNTLKGEDVFLLYDTFGFPLELTIEAASEHNVLVDEVGFAEQLNLQKTRARAARNNVQSMNNQNEDYLNFDLKSEFVGYETLETNAKVIAVFDNEKLVESGIGELVLVTDKTPFYGESGGQVGDKGLVIVDGEAFEVYNTFNLPNGQHAIQLETSVEISVGQSVILRVNENFRNSTSKNHSATHLLNQSLRNVLGKHVVQQGSLVNDKRLRFDFNHYENVTNEQLIEIEKLTNAAIINNYEVKVINTTVDNAKKLGAQALFGEKYGDVVRLVDMEYSKELCGGTHVNSTGTIGKLAILSIESKGSGIFRVEATTGNNIESQINETLININNTIDELTAKINDLLSSSSKEGINLKYSQIAKPVFVGSYNDIILQKEYANALQKQFKDLEKTYNNQLRNKKSVDISTFADLVVEHNDYQVLITCVENIEVNILKDLVDNLTANVNNMLVFVADKMDGKIVFICKAKNVPFNAGQLVKEAAIITGGNGGGRPDFAQAGGRDVAKLEDSIAAIKNKVGI